MARGTETLIVVRRCLDWLKNNWTWLKWPVALIVLSFLFFQHREGFARLGERRIQWHYLAIGLALCTVSIILTFLRWYLLVWAQAFPFRFRDALRLGFIGYLFNYVGPGGAGGDVAKGVMIAREQESRRAVAVTTIVLDRILGLLALFVVGAGAALIPTAIVSQTLFRPVVYGYFAGAAGGLVGLGLLLHPAVPRWKLLNKLVHLRYVGGMFGELINAVLLYQSRRRVLILSVVIGVVGHFGMLSSFYFSALALHPADEMPSYTAHLQFVPAAELAGVMVFFLPGGVGALEEAMATFYEMSGSEPDDGFLTSIAYRSLTIVIAAVGAGYYLTARKEIDAALDETETADQQDTSD